MLTFAKPPRRHANAARIGIAVLAAAGFCLGQTLAQDEPTKESDDKKIVYEDKDYDFKLIEPQDWKTMPNQGVAVPGKVRRVWTPDNVTTIVAFMQEPGQAYTPRVLLDSSVAGMKRLGCEILVEKVRDVGKMRAMWMVVEGDGTGGAITGKGDVRTVQHWVAVPREKDILVLLLTTPNEDYRGHKRTFERLVRSLEMDGEQTPEQRESK